MRTLQIENLPDDLYFRLQHIALDNNCNLSEAVIYLLNKSLEAPNTVVAHNLPTEPVAEVLQRIRSRPRVNPVDLGLKDSTTLIREDRDR